MIENMNKEELLKLSNEIDSKILELDIKEHENDETNIIIQVGKTYKAKNGDTIRIVSRNKCVYKAHNLTSNSDNPSEKLPTYYINGRKSRFKETNLDITGEV